MQTKFLLFLSFPLVISTAVSTAAAQSQPCELTAQVLVAPKAKGKGKKVKAKVGTKIEILDTAGLWTRVTIDGVEGYIPAKVLKKNCKPLEVPETKPAETKPAEPIETPPAPPPPPTPPAGPTVPAEGAPPMAGSETTPPAAPEATPTPAPGGAAVSPSGPAATDGTVGFNQEWATTKKPKVAVMEITASGSVSPELVFSSGLVVAKTINALGPLTALSGQDIEKMLGPGVRRESSACGDTKCLAEIGTAFGADYLITGDLSRTNDTYEIKFQLIATSAASVRQRVSRQYTGVVAGLADELRAASQALVSDLVNPPALASAPAKGADQPEFFTSSGPVDPYTHARHVRFWAWTGISTGAASLAGGGALFYLKGGQKDEATKSTFNTAAMVAAGTGVVALGIGVMALLSADNPPSPASASRHPEPLLPTSVAVTPDTFTLAWSF